MGEAVMWKWCVPAKKPSWQVRRSAPSFPLADAFLQHFSSGFALVEWLSSAGWHSGRSRKPNSPGHHNWMSHFATMCKLKNRERNAPIQMVASWS